jgi:5-formyltetrahydrofolate cyclo-ligase
MNKSELRGIYLEKRKTLSPTERENASRRLAKIFFASFDLSSVRTLHCYLSIERFGEIDTTHIIHCIWKTHPQIRVVVPRIDTKADDLESVLYTPETEVKHNSWLIPEPPEGDVVEPGSIDVVIVPLVCADVRGHRVGYGKGYYDRFLRKTRAGCLKIGLSFFPLVDAIKDVHEGDVPLDLILTPDGTAFPLKTSA